MTAFLSLYYSTRIELKFQGRGRETETETESLRETEIKTKTERKEEEEECWKYVWWKIPLKFHSVFEEMWILKSQCEMGSFFFFFFSFFFTFFFFLSFSLIYLFIYLFIYFISRCCQSCCCSQQDSLHGNLFTVYEGRHVCPILRLTFRDFIRKESLSFFFLSLFFVIDQSVLMVKKMFFLFVSIYLSRFFSCQSDKIFLCSISTAAIFVLKMTFF